MQYIFNLPRKKKRNLEWARQGCLLPLHPYSVIPWVWLSSSRAPHLVSSAAFIRKLSSVLSWRPLGCLHGAVLVTQQLPGWLKPPMRSRAWWHKAVSSRSPCPLVLLCLAAHRRHPLQCDPQFSSYLWAPNWLITHPQAKLCHSSCSATERSPPICSCPLPVLPKGPVSLHCLTPTCQLLYLASVIPAGSQTASAHGPFNSSNSLNPSFECFKVKKSCRDPVKICWENKAAPLVHLAVGYLWWLKSPPKCINFQIGLPGKADVRLQLLFLSWENQLTWLMLDFKACVMFIDGESSCFLYSGIAMVWLELSVTVLHSLVSRNLFHICILEKSVLQWDCIYPYMLVISRRIHWAAAINHERHNYC